MADWPLPNPAHAGDTLRAKPDVAATPRACYNIRALRPVPKHFGKQSGTGIGDMLLRIVSGVIGIPLLVLLVFIKQGLPFILGVGLISVIGLNEFYRGVRKTGARPQEWLGLASALLFLFAARQGFKSVGFELPAVLTLLVLASLTVELIRRDRAPIRNLGATLLGAVYVGWLFSYLVALRSVPGHTPVAGLGRELPLGAWLVLYIIFTAWAADTGSYFIGRRFGRHKLTPVLSPGKSWEGLLAGIAASIAMSAVMGGLIGIPWGRVFIIGIGVALVNLVGDLAESSMKRDIGIKDFGSLLPGHGGILDRFDGLLFAAPLFYYYVAIILRW